MMVGYCDASGVDGLCENAGRRAVMFGEDVSTSCTVQLSLANLTDCSLLRYNTLTWPKPH